MTRSIASLAALVVGLTILTACARTSVESVSNTTAKLPRAQLIVVHDFAVTAGDVALDHAAGLSCSGWWSTRQRASRS
jgi:hypothetical protein